MICVMSNAHYVCFVKLNKFFVGKSFDLFESKIASIRSFSKNTDIWIIDFRIVSKRYRDQKPNASRHSFKPVISLNHCYLRVDVLFNFFSNPESNYWRSVNFITLVYGWGRVFGFSQAFTLAF